MIVFHSFFYKSHPKYLNRAVGMMRDVNNCAFMDHKELDVFIESLKVILKADGGGRYERRDISLCVVPGQIQIEVKHGMDYAARISLIYVEKALEIGRVSSDVVVVKEFTQSGETRYVKM